MDIRTQRTTASPVRGHVLIAHGYAEHSGRYARLVTQLLDGGYDVSFYDHEGHGTSPGSRAQVDVGRLIRDHIHARRLVLAESRSPRLVLFGHSMGGLITAASALIDRSHLRGVILSAPAFQPLPRVSPTLVRALLPLARLFPGMRIPAGASSLDNPLLSRRPEVQIDFDADPLNYHGATPLLTAATIVTQGQQALAHAARMNAPLLVFHGSADRLTSPKGSRLFVDRVRAAHEGAGVDAHLRVIDGAAHELLNEPESPMIMRDILLWLDRH